MNITSTIYLFHYDSNKIANTNSSTTISQTN